MVDGGVPWLAGPAGSTLGSRRWGSLFWDDRIRLHWTTDGSPVAVIAAEAIDPVDALVESWPDAAALAELPIAEGWRGAANAAPEGSPSRAFATRARAAAKS